MGKILLLTRREVSTFFVTPAAYIVMATFLAFSTFIFVYFDWRPGSAAAMRAALQGMVIILMVMVPILTMRSLAEEKGSGTIESLLTTPVTDTQVVVAKFLGCWIVFAVMLLPTLVFPLLLALFGNPDFGPMAAGYVGLLLVGAMYVAVGLAASSLTKSQVVAALVGILALLMVGLVLWIIAQVIPSPWRQVLLAASVMPHFEDFRQGFVDLVHVIYFAAVTLFTLFFTVKVLESRRWR